MGIFDLNEKCCYWFSEISAIPRPSGEEKAISEFIREFAEKRNLRYKQDDTWNIMVFKPGQNGGENASPLILQAHTDMVAEKKEGSSHDFGKDPIELVEENGLLKAKDTTLGADDGMGVAYMLAILDDPEMPHPPLECIFTTMEEIGLVGAMNLKPEDIQADRFITLDAVEEAVADLCSAGGCYVYANTPLTMEPCTMPVYRLTAGGLRGGHSGADIHLEHANAVMVAARMIYEMTDAGMDVHMVSIDGGTMMNSITRQCSIVFASSSSFEEVKKQADRSGREIAAELESGDPDFTWTVENASSAECADSSSTMDVLNFLMTVPDGFQHKSMAITGLTVTSLNLGITETKDSKVNMSILLRSMFDSAVKDMVRRIRIAGAMTHTSVKDVGYYPGWQYSEHSPIREKYAKACADSGKPLRIQATHGGLEAGVFAGLHPGLDITTVAGDCRYFHTTEEELDIASFIRAYGILKNILEQCCHD